MKYIVMECHFSYAILLDEEGRFIKAANRSYQVGQIVERIVPLEETRRTASSSRWVRNLAIVAAACFIMVAAFLFTALFNQQDYASVFLSINPSVRLDVDRKETVRRLTGLNEDGKLLIRDYDHRGKTLQTAVDDLIDRAIDMGYLSAGQMVTINLDSTDVIWADGMEAQLGRHLSGTLSEKIAVTIQIGQDSAGKQKVIIPIPARTTPDTEVTTPGRQPDASDPTAKVTTRATPAPTSAPTSTIRRTNRPTPAPTSGPTPTVTSGPTPTVTSRPTPTATSRPAQPKPVSPTPTMRVTARPTPLPTVRQTTAPTPTPTVRRTQGPTRTTRPDDDSAYDDSAYDDSLYD